MVPPFAAILALAASIAAGQTGALRIVVIEGEDAVNIVQQKTAVAPVVEVRDRNNQPVAGAIVRFAIEQGRGTFAGARTLSVTTNAAGRAVATGLTPTGGGALQIGASATFQGQTVVATITQTNVMTAAAAEAAAAGATSGTGTSGASSASGGAAGGGGGGGVSGTTIGIVGGAVAGGAVAASTVLGGGDSDAESNQRQTTYRGTFSMQTTFHLFTTNNGVIVGGCQSQPAALTGSVTVRLDDRGEGEVELEWTETLTATPQCLGIAPAFSKSGPISSATNISILHESPADYESPAGTVHIRRVGTFSGALTGESVTGTVTMAHDQRLTAPASPGLVVDGGFPTISTTVTLTK